MEHFTYENMIRCFFLLNTSDVIVIVRGVFKTVVCEMLWLRTYTL